MDGLYREVMHERELPKYEFLAFIGNYPDTILTIFVNLESGKYPGVATLKKESHHG